MGKRRTGRKLAMQALYQMDMREDEADEVGRRFLEQEDCLEETRAWATHLSKVVWEKRDELDALIAKQAKAWSLDRLNPIDKAILRIALYELSYTDTTKNIVLNEAIEISKKFSTDDSPKFINGILGALVD